MTQPTADQSRLDRTASQPRALGLWQLIHGLRSPLRFMSSGAHPDDECAPMLAALHFRDGIGLSYACSTRGEGGQNNLGPERGPVLGALRTAEMEAACDVLNMRMYWLSESPDDSVTDWRFSKSGGETLAKWDHDRTLARMVHILRRDKPDMVCPTFLDVPGQHGHHRAMTRIAHQAFAAAADPGYPGCDLPAWTVSKLYLPAWSGAGRAYDDDLPPPPATVTVSGTGQDAFTGWSYARIGAMSHGHHRSQGMGHWPRDERDFPLHLAESLVGSDRGSVSDNLPANMSDLGVAGFDQLVAEMPDLLATPGRLQQALAEADALLNRADPDPKDAHRFDLKRLQIARLKALAAGVVPDVTPADIWVRPGALTNIDPQQGEVAELALPDGWNKTDAGFGPAADHPPYDGYRDSYDPLIPPRPALRVLHNGVETLWPLDRPVIAGPARELALSPSRLVINLGAGQVTAQSTIGSIHPPMARVTSALPDGWHMTEENGILSVSAPQAAAEGRYQLPLCLDGKEACTVYRFDQTHIRPTQFAHIAKLEVSVVDVPVPDHAVGYLGGGLDTLAPRLKEMGVDLRDLGRSGLDKSALAELPSLIIGTHAFGFNAGLAEATPLLHDWVQAGGNLLTLYHRPWDNWDPDKTPLARLEIGQPSLRWRVTNAQAPVRILAPDHPLLNEPVPIDQAAFDDWDKERGLYFAKSWDEAYTPLLEMADEGDPPLQGGLLSGVFGKGRHTHCALNLHHQLEHGIPGAMRLLMALITR